MNLLPASIEAYLLEADFSSTEVTILKKLLEVDALTLRQVASKTGKSTGVLDTAMDKLIKKNIVHKENINENAKYSLTSLDAVKDWMEADMKKRREELTRRHQNFETFLLTLSMDKTRPEMEHFHGMQGIEQVYNKVLREGQEMLQYVPVVCSAEDDPMRDFRVEYFRERRRRGLFSRVVAHNTSLGRRYQSRDPFEYRQTVLVPDDHYPFSFEKIITGDTVTCINHMEKRACFLRYPELAQMERSNFESIWRRETAPKAEEQKTTEEAQKAPAGTVIPMKVKTLSSLREFFLSRESLVSMSVLAIVAGVITYGLYSYTSALNLQRMRDKVISIAATGVYQFIPQELDALRNEDDWKKPEWAIVSNKLKQIRSNNPGILYAYILRKAENNSMEFVGDADSINPYANLDDDPSNNVNVDDEGIDHGGKIESVPSDALVWPGYVYKDQPKQAYEAYEKNTTSEIYQDQWGQLISGYSPIRDENGITVAVLAVDTKANQLQKLNAQTFVPAFYFLAIFMIFFLIRLAAFNRSLLREVWEVFQLRKTLIVLIFCAELSFFITFGFYQYMMRQTINEVGIKLMSIAATGAPQFSTTDLDSLHWAKDMKTEAYQRVFKELNKIKNANSNITYVYIMRPVEMPDLWEFLADSYSNYDLPSLNPDVNGDGGLDEADENIAPGVRYIIRDLAEAAEALERPTYGKNFDTDQWGTGIVGDAPIKDTNGVTHAILSVYADVSEVREQLNKKFIPWLWFTGGFSGLLVLYLLFKKHFA